MSESVHLGSCPWFYLFIFLVKTLRSDSEEPLCACRKIGEKKV